jgi:hypothetical protein
MQIQEGSEDCSRPKAGPNTGIMGCIMQSS